MLLSKLPLHTRNLAESTGVPTGGMDHGIMNTEHVNKLKICKLSWTYFIKLEKMTKK